MSEDILHVPLQRLQEIDNKLKFYHSVSKYTQKGLEQKLKELEDDINVQTDSFIIKTLKKRKQKVENLLNTLKDYYEFIP